MEVPDLVRQSLGDEEIVAGVSLGDEDAVCFTPTRALVYRGEGLLSDEGVSEYPLEFERLAVSEGRRKTKFTLTYVDDESSFAVPGNRADPVLQQLLEGSLQGDGVLAENESVAGVYRFSELTLIVGQRRLLKHVGEYTWDGDFEVFPFDDVTGLHFEDGSVATAVVLEVDGRPERIKAPNDEARVVRKTLEEALFAHYDVDSLDALNRAIAVEDEDPAGDADADQSGGLDLESGIDPLVSDPETEEAAEADASGAGAPSASSDGTSRATSAQESSERAVEQTASTVDPTDRADAADAGSDDLAAVNDQLAELTAAVERQNELLERQQRTIKQLIQELRQGR